MGSVRLLLAVAVVLSHSPAATRELFGLQFIDADSAVQLFFVISGFFIAFVLDQNDSYIKPLRFYASRFLRLWPIYIVCVLASFGIAGYGFVLEWYPKMGLLAQAFIILTNLTMVFQDAVLFLRVDWSTGNLEFTSAFWKDPQPAYWQFLRIPPAWSLGIELTFYAIAPFVVRSLRRTVLLLALGLTARWCVYMAVGWGGDPWYYRFMPAELTFFFIGALTFHISKPVVLRMNGTMLRLVGAAAICVMIALVALRGFMEAPTVFEPLMMKDHAVILTFAALIPFALAASQSSGIDRLLGDLSYPTYIVHGLAGGVLFQACQSVCFSNSLYIVATLAASATLLLFIDRPVTRLRARYLGADRRPVPADVTLSARTAQPSAR